MGEGGIIAMGACFGCRQPFSFDPAEVPSVVVDPSTGAPVPQEGPAPEGAFKAPLCDPCVDRVEALRRKMGLPAAWPRSSAQRRVRSS